MPQNPANWDEYHYGKATNSGSMSTDRRQSVTFDDNAISPSSKPAFLRIPSSSHDVGQQQQQNLQRRRSSIAQRLDSIAYAGGRNSIANFAQSWTRAASFMEVTPHRPSFILSVDNDIRREGEDTIQYGRSDARYRQASRVSLLRAHLEASGLDNAIDESVAEDETDQFPPRPSLTRNEPMNNRLSRVLSPSSYGTSYGTIRSSIDASSMVHAGRLWKQQQAEANTEEGRDSIVVKEVEQDGKVILVVEGQSTLPQTIFNSTNVIIGVGILSLPMGIKYSGWLCGSVLLALSAIVTQYTARVLARCMDIDASLITFADLAFVSYGPKARMATSVLFMLELLAACVALVVLFADTLYLLAPGVSINEWKIICGLALVPLNFAPLRLLSITSVVGIFSTLGIVIIIFTDGFIKPHTPGSLRDLAETRLFPATWLTLPLSFGLLMSPWGGHSVFPNIYRDMRHPQKFPKAISVTFIAAYLLDCATAVAGYFMFGELVMTEITANLIATAGYPRIMRILMTIFIAVIPVTKLPLSTRPIISTLDTIFGLNPSPDQSSSTGLSGYKRTIVHVSNRVFVVAVFVVIAIVFPAFDSIMAFMGSALCIAICVILPLMFYLKLFGKELSVRERILDYFLIAVCSVLAVVGTVWAFLPKRMIGAE